MWNFRRRSLRSTGSNRAAEFFQDKFSNGHRHSHRPEWRGNRGRNDFGGSSGRSKRVTSAGAANENRRARQLFFDASSGALFAFRIERRAFEPNEQDITVGAGETREWNARLTLARASENVVVTATAQPLLAENSPNLADVITRAQIEQRQEIWLTDMLASQQGISFSRLGAYGGVTSFFLDGGNSNYTKVLIDGTPANEPGGAYDF